MSKITIILLLCLCGFKSLAQDIDFDKQLGVEYADFDLSKYIKTKYDFDQSQMTEADIDKKIGEIEFFQCKAKRSKCFRKIGSKEILRPVWERKNKVVEIGEVL